MAKVKFTKGELKKQRDALRQYLRYLPTLQLKKQQLQIEILSQLTNLEEKERLASAKTEAAQVWAGLLTSPDVNLKAWVTPQGIISSPKNIAGVEFPVFERAQFGPVEYDLFSAPLWVDAGIETLKAIMSLREEIGVIEKGIGILRQELRIATQRVNLFEKVKIPEALENIRLIKIYIGDQMANAVGRSKIAKRKIELSELSLA